MFLKTYAYEIPCNSISLVNSPRYETRIPTNIHINVLECIDCRMNPVGPETKTVLRIVM